MPLVWVETVEADWRRMPEVDELLWEVLYRDFSVPVEGPWRHAGAHGVLAVALAEDGRLFGSARLMDGGEGEPLQLRQLAVRQSARGFGLGHALLLALEEAAADQAAPAVWLNARDTAYGFYEREGYRFAGETFVSDLTGIPHRRMEKDLAGWRCISCRPKRAGIWLSPTV